MTKKTAILFSGSSYNVKFSLPSLLQNLIIPNDADVFVFTTRVCKRRITPASEIPDASDNEKWNEKNATTIVDESPLSDDEIQLIKDTFGERLKMIAIAEDDYSYMEYIRDERTKMAEIVNWYIGENQHLKLPLPFQGTLFTRPNDNSSNGTIRCVIDQYRHVKKCYEMMEQYENENGFKYEWVVRARIDFIVPFELNLKFYSEQHDKPYLYIGASAFRTDSMEFLDEYFWFSKRVTAAKLFPHLDKMGLLHDRKYQTFQWGTEYSKEAGNDFMFDPETQWSILLHELGITELIQVRLNRSACYSRGDDGYDYFNYLFQRTTTDLDYEYELTKNCETDINEHIPILKSYAEQSDLVVELGVRFANSTIGIMGGRPKKFLSYDVHREKRIDYIELVARENNVDWEFVLQNPTPEDGSPSLLPDNIDFLFIDTNHTGTQIGRELNLHAHKVRKWIGMHDLVSFGSRGMGDENIWDGMMPAVELFLENHKDEWRIKDFYKNNNGLMVLERINQQQ